MTTTVHIGNLERSVGLSLGASRWISIEQDRINSFAEDTEDRQWIHVDPARAASGPFGAPVAHGYLTLSLLSAFLEDLIEVEGAGVTVNYGLDRVRFPAPVRVGTKVRAIGEVAHVRPVASGAQVVFAITVEAADSEKPACVAEMVVRYLGVLD